MNEKQLTKHILKEADTSASNREIRNEISYNLLMFDVTVFKINARVMPQHSRKYRDAAVDCPRLTTTLIMTCMNKNRDEPWDLTAVRGTNKY
jgi:hypothetical protein